MKTLLSSSLEKALKSVVSETELASLGVLRILSERLDFIKQIIADRILEREKELEELYEPDSEFEAPWWNK